MTASAARLSGRQDEGRTSDSPPIRLMIVDDSPIARAVLSRMLAGQKDFEIMAVAGSAREALDALRSTRVDIILLDLEMPGGSGLDALPEILRAGAGARVLVVSSLCESGAEAAVRALARGATDTLPKPGTGNFAGRFAEVLAERLRRIGRVKREGAEAVQAAALAPIRLRDMPDWKLGCVAIGASTGGLHAIHDFLQALPPRIGAPILVTQHLPTLFMPFFARQLEAVSGRSASIAEEGEWLRDEHIHVAPGDAHLFLQRHGARVQVKLKRERAPCGCLPSIDPMLTGVAECYGKSAVGVMLSGMGRDGMEGSRKLVASGGAMLAQDRASSAVWGMPRVVAEAGLASAVLAPAELARRVAAKAGAAPWK